jgi:hypothetical protein
MATRIVVDRCEACGEICCHDVRGGKAQCRACRRIAAIPRAVEVITETREPIERRLLASNPSLHARLQIMGDLAREAADELAWAGKLRQQGPSCRLTFMRLADLPDDPDTARFQAALEHFDAMPPYEQRALLTRIDEHLNVTRLTRRATGFLHGLAGAMPGRLTPLRIVLPMAMFLSVLTVLTLVYGEAGVPVSVLAGIVAVPLILLPLISAALFPARLRAWFRDEFMCLAEQRGLPLDVLIRLLEVAEQGKRIDPRVRALAGERWTLIEIIQELSPPSEPIEPAYVPYPTEMASGF